MIQSLKFSERPRITHILIHAFYIEDFVLKLQGDI